MSHRPPISLASLRFQPVHAPSEDFLFCPPPTFGFQPSNVPRHLTPLFPVASALFLPIEPHYILCFQLVANSFPSHRGGALLPRPRWLPSFTRPPQEPSLNRSRRPFTPPLRHSFTSSVQPDHQPSIWRECQSRPSRASWARPTGAEGPLFQFGFRQRRLISSTKVTS